MPARARRTLAILRHHAITVSFWSKEGSRSGRPLAIPFVTSIGG
jgi:hypothetical protein